MVFSNYDEYSRFADWLAKQPEALSVFFDMLHAQYRVQRGRALIMLAEAVAHCEAQPLQSCAETLKKSNSIHSLVRTSLFSEKVDDAIEAEGFCGNREDLKLLEKLVSQQHPEGIDIHNQDQVDAFHQNVARMESKIKQRLDKQ